jgi:hypothetical protein
MVTALDGMLRRHGTRSVSKRMENVSRTLPASHCVDSMKRKVSKGYVIAMASRGCVCGLPLFMEKWMMKSHGLEQSSNPR